MAEDVLLSERDGGVAIFTLNRPASKNALNPALTIAFSNAVRAAAGDDAVRAIVVTGAGGAFCAGADLKAAMMEGFNAFEHLDQAIEQVHAMIRAVVDAPKPVVAAVDGAAVGFGCDLALACDLRVLSSEAYLQEKFVKIGLMPDGGGTFWLPRLVGVGRAMEFILTGEAIRAEQALALGVANRVVSPSALRGAALEIAHQLAKGPPIAYAEIKRAVRAGLGGTIDDALANEKAGQMRCLKSNDCMEGVMAWMQKREPNFTGK
ncbi:MAG TPA: enoyl-CoA hydratase-related protein [Minicystis sp.]|nr:enoyl-CoA hydratase-related protein [Minicystis sp.]